MQNAEYGRLATAILGVDEVKALLHSAFTIL